MPEAVPSVQNSVLALRKRRGRAARRAGVAVIGSLALLLIVAGCSTDRYVTLPGPTDTTGAVETTPAPTGQAPIGGYDATLKLTDYQNYVMTFDIHFAVTAITVTTENDVPGQASAAVQFKASATVTNNTPGHSLTFATVDGYPESIGYPRIYIVAVFAPGSVVCGAATVACSIYYITAKAPGTVADGASAPLSIFNGSPLGNSAELKAFPEASKAEVQKELANPTDFAIVYVGGDSCRFTGVCPNAGPTDHGYPQVNATEIAHQSSTCTQFTIPTS